MSRYKLSSYIIVLVLVLFSSCKQATTSGAPTTTDVTIPENTTEVKGIIISSEDSASIISWVFPTDNSIESVEITWTPNAGIPTQPLLIERNATVNNYVEITNLVNGTLYIFTIRTINTDGVKSKGVVIGNTPMFNNVTNIVGTSSGSSITLSWENPTDPDFSKVQILIVNGLQVTTYYVEKTDTPNNSITMTGFTTGSYRFMVRAGDSKGNFTKVTAVTVTVSS